MWVGLGIMETVVLQSILEYRHHKSNANKKEKKVTLEEHLLAGGREDCGCPRLDGYKVQKQ